MRRLKRVVEWVQMTYFPNYFIVNSEALRVGWD